MVVNVAGLQLHLRASEVESALLTQLLAQGMDLTVVRTGRTFDSAVRTEDVTIRGQLALPLSWHPLTAITTLHYYSNLIDPGDYEVKGGRLIRKDDCYWAGGTYTVKYTAGYVNTAVDDDVPAGLALAVYQLCASLYKGEPDYTEVDEWALR